MLCLDNRGMSTLNSLHSAPRQLSPKAVGILAAVVTILIWSSFIVIARASAKTPDTKVLLLGMQLPPNYGQRYTRAFAAVYGNLAAESRCRWYRSSSRALAVWRE